MKQHTDWLKELNSKRLIVNLWTQSCKHSHGSNDEEWICFETLPGFIAVSKRTKFNSKLELYRYNFLQILRVPRVADYLSSWYRLCGRSWGR